MIKNCDACWLPIIITCWWNREKICKIQYDLHLSEIRTSCRMSYHGWNHNIFHSKIWTPYDIESRSGPGTQAHATKIGAETKHCEMKLHPVWHAGKVGNFDFTTKWSVQPHVNPKAWNNLFGSKNWIWNIWSSAAFVLEWLFWIQQLDSVHWSSGAHFMHSFSLEGAPFWLQINCEQNWTETKCAWRWSPSSSSSRPSSSSSSLSSSTFYSILHE